jgi:hypothetical protein
MRLDAPFLSLHQAIAEAVHSDLPDVVYEDRDWTAWRNMPKPEQTLAMQNNTIPCVTKSRRPVTDEIEVVMFPQMWGSTALGYGGMGGAAITQAYTIIVSSKHRRQHCVYFGGRKLAYAVDYDTVTPQGRLRFEQDMARRAMVSVDQKSVYE